MPESLPAGPTALISQLKSGHPHLRLMVLLPGSSMLGRLPAGQSIYRDIEPGGWDPYHTNCGLPAHPGFEASCTPPPTGKSLSLSSSPSPPTSPPRFRPSSPLSLPRSPKLTPCSTLGSRLARGGSWLRRGRLDEGEDRRSRARSRSRAPQLGQQLQ